MFALSQTYPHGGFSFVVLLKYVSSFFKIVFQKRFIDPCIQKFDVFRQSSLGMNDLSSFIIHCCSRAVQLNTKHVFHIFVGWPAASQGQSVMQAVLEGKFDDIELWAEQAQTLGEEKHRPWMRLGPLGIASPMLKRITLKQTSSARMHLRCHSSPLNGFKTVYWLGYWDESDVVWPLFTSRFVSSTLRQPRFSSCFIYTSAW